MISASTCTISGEPARDSTRPTRPLVDEGGVALDQTGFPEAMGERLYYQPVERGLEIKLKEKLDRLRTAREQARKAQR